MRSLIHTMRSGPRQGVAAVEFAVIAPLVFLLVFGMIEFGRAIMVHELLNNSARNGARLGVIQGRSNSDVDAVIKDTLAKNNINAPLISIQVNGVEKDVSAAETGDNITVTVSVQASEISWLPVDFFLGSKALTSTVVMRRE